MTNKSIIPCHLSQIPSPRPFPDEDRPFLISGRCLAVAPLLALLAISVVADNVDLPVATQGTEQWSGVLAKAMTMGGRNQEASLQALQSFQDKVFAKVAKTVSSGSFTQLITAKRMSFLPSCSSPLSRALHGDLHLRHVCLS